MHKLNIYSVTRVLFILPRYGTNALSKFSPDTELVLYPLQDKLTLGDKSLDLSAFKLSCLFFSLLSSGSSSCWRSYGAQLRILKLEIPKKLFDPNNSSHGMVEGKEVDSLYIKLPVYTGCWDVPCSGVKKRHDLHCQTVIGHDLDFLVS
ncbi:hypothetical protein Tco_1254192 [Tanacetum coccineum]